MNQLTNQAVLFTKPIHHLSIELDLEELDRLTRSFFQEKGFRFIASRTVTGSVLAEHKIIELHYLMYSRGSYGDVVLSPEGKANFESSFGKGWDAEMAAGRIMGNPQLMESKGIDAPGLFDLWNALFTSKRTHKIDSGLVMGWIDELDCYVINGFYPAMEANFNHPASRINYYVVDFDPAQVSWRAFRERVLGATDAGKADPESFRGRLYALHGVDFPARDNFLHGSAGPLEGFMERINFEPGFDMATNPVGRYLANRGVTLERFKQWKSNLSTAQLDGIFDATEETNTAEALSVLDSIHF